MSGLHVCKFYAGREHLISSILIEAREAIENGCMFVYFTDEDLEEKLYAYFKKIDRISGIEEVATSLNMESQEDYFHSSVIKGKINDLNFVNVYKNETTVYDDMKRYMVEASKKRFSAVNICIQMDSLYYLLGKKKLKIIEKNIENIVTKDTNIKITCFYDLFKSYENKLLEDIMENHEYASHCSKVYKLHEIYN